MSETFPAVFGFQLFDGLDWWHVTALTLVYLFAYFIKGAIGVGNLAMMVLLGALILDPHHAVVLAVATTCIAQLQFLREGIRYTDWSITKPVILSTYVGIGIGILIFGNLDGAWLTIILGSILGVLILADITKLMTKLSETVDFRHRGVLYPATLFFGFISGVSGAGTLSSITFYFKQIAPDARTLRATIFILGIIFAGWRLLLLWLAGFLTTSVILEAALLVPPMLYLGHLGTKFFYKMSDRRYHQYLQLMLFCIAMVLVVKGIIKLM